MALHTAEKLPVVCLPEIAIGSGSHATRGSQACVMEVVAWMAGERHTDAPECVSPVIAAFMRRWNDDLPDDETRNRLFRPLLESGVLLNTRTTPADEEQRAWLVLDWLVRTHTPAWFDLVPSLSEDGVALRNLPALSGAAASRAAQKTIDEARSCASSTWAAAGDGARAAAGDAAWDAARAAAGDAAWDAARAAAWDAAWDAARAAAWDAARAAAWDAAWAAARAAARAAANERLAPTVERLQQSALELVEALCGIGRE